jgi:glycosyltransferase involved in cell wall biosynthesis
MGNEALPVVGDAAMASSQTTDYSTFDLYEYPAPTVSVILTTRDRPRLLQIALGCYTHQTYPHRELVVVDDGSHWPADSEAVAEAGGRLIRVEPGTPLGTKLNRGVEVSHGALCQKMDDDDWYGPDFLQHMVKAWRKSQRYLSLPVIMGGSPHPVFDLNRWEIRTPPPGGVAGGTLLFARQVWEQRPFRPIVKAEDGWFILDQSRLGTRLMRVDVKETYLLVRHGGIGVDRGHTWRYWWNQTVEEAITHLQIYKGPEDVLPDWAVAAYTEIRGASPVAPSSILPRRFSSGKRGSKSTVDMQDEAQSQVERVYETPAMPELSAHHN